MIALIYILNIEQLSISENYIFKYKGRNLEKLQVCCTPLGKVIFIDGPCLSDKHNNDDNMTWDKVVIDSDLDVNKIFDKSKHTFCMDRGYISCGKGADYFDLIWPCKWNEDTDEQLPTMEANESR